MLYYSREDVIDKQVLKQPDVLMLSFLLPEKFSAEIIKANWDYYEPKSVNDSSLSHTVHCVTACQTGNIEEAYKYFQSGITIDIGDNPVSSDDGIHAGALGGVWIMLTQGFCGIHERDGQLWMSPRLPQQWNLLEFPFRWQGGKLRIKVTAENVHIWASDTLHFNLYGKEAVAHGNTWTEFVIKNGGC